MTATSAVCIEKDLLLYDVLAIFKILNDMNAKPFAQATHASYGQW
jgi:hypothetical protein